MLAAAAWPLLLLLAVRRSPLQPAGLELSRDHPAESRLFCLEIIQGAPLLLGELEQPLRETVAAKVAVIQGWIDAGKLAPVAPYHLIFSLWANYIPGASMSS